MFQVITATTRKHEYKMSEIRQADYYQYGQFFNINNDFKPLKMKMGYKINSASVMYILD